MIEILHEPIHILTLYIHIYIYTYYHRFQALGIKGHARFAQACYLRCPSPDLTSAGLCSCAQPALTRHLGASIRRHIKCPLPRFSWGLSGPCYRRGYFRSL